MFLQTFTNLAFHRLNLLRVLGGTSTGQSSSSLAAANQLRTNYPNSLSLIKIAQPILSSKSSSLIIGNVQAYQYHCSNSILMASKQTASNKKADPAKSTKTRDQKDQFIHDHLNSSQDFNQNLEDHIPFEHELVKEPPRERFGVLKAIMIIIAGIYFGSYVAMVGAKLLEDLDIFVKERDDDDD